MADTTWTTPAHIEAVSRPLRTADEQSRAAGLIASVERLLVGRWPRIPEWIAADRLDVDTIADVVTWLVLPVLGVDASLPVNVRSWQDTGGTESRQVTLGDTAAGAFFELSPWMVDVFDRLAREDDPSSGKPTGGATFGGGHSRRVRDLFPADRPRQSWP